MVAKWSWTHGMHQQGDTLGWPNMDSETELPEKDTEAMRVCFSKNLQKYEPPNRYFEHQQNEKVGWSARIDLHTLLYSHTLQHITATHSAHIHSLILYCHTLHTHHCHKLYTYTHSYCTVTHCNTHTPTHTVHTSLSHTVHIYNIHSLILQHTLLYCHKLHTHTLTHTATYTPVRSHTATPTLEKMVQKPGHTSTHSHTRTHAQFADTDT